MKFDTKDLDILRELVVEASKEELMSRFRHVASSAKADGTLVTEADLAMQKCMELALAERWPDVGFLGEEMTAEEQQRLLDTSGQALWVLDPLDGTSNYAAGIPCFAPSLALVSEGKVIAGVVYDPVLDECFSALRGQGAWLNDEPLDALNKPETLKEAMAMVDLKRLPSELIEAFAKRAPYRSQRSFGSVALDWCWVAAGRFQVYLHGGQKLWDYAAGHLILSETSAVGGHCDDYYAEFSEVLTLTPRIGIAASDPALLELWRAWLKENLKGDSNN